MTGRTKNLFGIPNGVSNESRGTAFSAAGYLLGIETGGGGAFRERVNLAKSVCKFACPSLMQLLHR
jgi:hypothetical protein